MTSSSSPLWFEHWFDSHYYHALYTSRDEKEADHFLSQLLEKIHIPKGAKILDLACGKGRHARFLNQSGYDVLGVDLSENSIHAAKKMENEHLHFKTGDMREPQGLAEFDVVLNLFTSFGYFESASENIRTLEAIHQSLKPNGLLVIDFMNSEKAIQTLQPEHHIKREGIEFFITKTIENQIISKKISFTDNHINHAFEERVQLLTLTDFRHYFDQTGFKELDHFGDYHLQPFDSQHSDRLILVAQKK